ncbi:MAG: hypothetical protein FWG56_11950 [Desulfovibrionaceae bacterium]|nr:hypothetical protein [Desulfovibrionaceae bacterium]
MIALIARLLAALAAIGIGAGGAWWVQAQRYGLQIEQIKRLQTSADLQSARQAVAQLEGIQKGFSDALANFQSVQQTNAAAQRDLDRTLLDLRGAAAGLRGDFAALPQRIAAAAQPALAEYAATCTAVFEELAERGTRLAESGAELARKADGHAADARLMQEWPHRGSD